MGKIVRQGVEYGGSSNSADCIKYNETKNVKEAIDEIKASSSSNPTAASVTFNNTDTGLNATNVQDAVTEVNGNLSNLIKSKTVTTNTFSVVSGIPLSKPIVSCSCDYNNIGLVAFPTNRGGYYWAIDIRKANDWSLNDISTTVTVTYLDI